MMHHHSSIAAKCNTIELLKNCYKILTKRDKVIPYNNGEIETNDRFTVKIGLEIIEGYLTVEQKAFSKAKPPCRSNNQQWCEWDAQKRGHCHDVLTRLKKDAQSKSSKCRTTLTLTSIFNIFHRQRVSSKSSVASK